MDVSNIYRFNGVDPFDNWTIKDNKLYGYYPRNSLINLLNKDNYINKDNTIIISNIVTSINGSAFRKVNKYKEIIIPPSVNKISKVAFLDSSITLIVSKNSYAEKYAKKMKLNYKIYKEHIYEEMDY